MLWPSQKTIILADWHFGKIGHFRKAGIALPKSPFTESLQKITSIADQFNCNRLLVLGDLFHSDYNEELNYFKSWKAEEAAAITIDMVRGNHDILSDEVYHQCSINNLGPYYKASGIHFVHDPEDAVEGLPTMSGHIHPGVTLRGKGRQALRLPVFWFGEYLTVLPAFGTFTGKSRIKAAKHDRIFIPASNKIIEFDVATGMQK